MSIEEHLAITVQQTLTELVGRLTARLDALEQLRSGPQQLLYHEREAAALLGLAPATLKKWRCAGHVQAHTPKRARLPLYSHADLERIAGQLAAGEIG